MTGPSAWSHPMVSVLVVASNTRMFLGAARGTGRKTQTLSQARQDRTETWDSAFHPVNVSNSRRVRTCSAAVVHPRPLAVSVQRSDTDRVRRVGDQVVQEGVVDVSWDQDLKDTTADNDWSAGMTCDPQVNES